MLLALVPFGLTTWAAFLYVGIAYKRRKWQIASAAYAVTLFAAQQLAHHDQPVANRQFAGFLVLAIWLGGIAHAIGVRQQLKAPPQPPPDPALAAATVRLKERRDAQRFASRSPARARELGIGRPDVPGADPRGVVDINNASPEAIVYTAGVTREVADAIVAARERAGGLSSVAAVGSVPGLRPTDVERLKLFCVCLPR